MDQAEFVMPPRPLGVYVMTLFSVVRAIIELLAAYGLFIIYRVSAPVEGMPITGGLSFTNLRDLWVSGFSPEGQLSVIVSLVQVAAFLVLAVGIFQGLSWGRVGFLWASVAVLLWRIVPLAWGARIALGALIYNVIAVCFSTWYFRRPKALEYFGVKDTLPKWLKIKIGKIPLDLGIALVLSIFMVLIEISGLVRLTQTAPSVIPLLQIVP